MERTPRLKAEGLKIAGSGTAVSINLPLPLFSAAWLKLPSPLMLLLLHSHFLLPSPRLPPSRFTTFLSSISSLPNFHHGLFIFCSDDPTL